MGNKNVRIVDGLYSEVEDKLPDIVAFENITAVNIDTVVSMALLDIVIMGRQKEFTRVFPLFGQFSESPLNNDVSNSTVFLVNDSKHPGTSCSEWIWHALRSPMSRLFEIDALVNALFEHEFLGGLLKFDKHSVTRSDMVNNPLITMLATNIQSSIINAAALGKEGAITRMVDIVQVVASNYLNAHAQRMQSIDKIIFKWMYGIMVVQEYVMISDIVEYFKAHPVSDEPTVIVWCLGNNKYAIGVIENSALRSIPIPKGADMTGAWMNESSTILVCDGLDMSTVIECSGVIRRHFHMSDREGEK